MPDRRQSELRSWQPGYIDSLKYRIAGLLGDDRQAVRDAEKITSLLEYAPGVGDAMAAGEAADEYSAGNYGTAGLLAAGAMAGLVPGVGDVVQKGVKKAVKAAENVRVMPLSVNDFHGGEAFGYKELRVDGNPMAAADVNVYGDEVSIRDIVTRPEARRKGYATKLVDDLFAEFPDKKIMITGTTPDGTAFFGNKYNVLPDGQITKKEVKPKGIRAYHGSPHDFDKFSLDKIGTGEGAQAYGHGLYFAENEGVARDYRNAFMRNFTDAKDAEGVAVFALKTAKDDRQEAIKYIDGLMAKAGPNSPVIQYGEEAKALLSSDQHVGPRMYEVNINADPNDFLDWDKPLSEQPRILEQFGYNDAKYPDDWIPDVNMTGAELYRRYAGQTNSGVRGDANVAAYNQLASGAPRPIRARDGSIIDKPLRIPGIKYLDAGSRSAGDGSRNYVVFDDALIEILRKYGLAGMGLLGAGAMQGGGEEPVY